MKKLSVLFFMILLASPGIVSARNEPNFYFLRFPQLCDPKGRILGVVEFSITGMTEIEARQKMISDHLDAIDVPPSVIEKSISPKIGEKIWVFTNSKLLGTAMVTRVKFALNDNDVFVPSFDLSEERFQEAITFHGSYVSYPGIFVSVPDGTAPEDNPKECIVSRSVCQKLLNKIRLESSTAVVDQTFQVMGEKFIVIFDDKGDEERANVDVYKVGKNGFKKFYKRHDGDFW